MQKSKNIHGPFRLDNNHFRFMSPECSMPHTIVTYFYKVNKNHVTFSYVLHFVNFIQYLVYKNPF